MKKIIGLLVISTLLISCTDNTSTETNIQEPSVALEENVENKINTGSLDEGNDTTEIPESKETKEVETKDAETEKETKKETNTEKSNSEEVLESEVNDLLDEFIDSLENYDK